MKKQQTVKQWENFVGGSWTTNVDVRDFIQKNYTPYNGGSDFLQPSTKATKKLWDQIAELARQEQENGGVLSMDKRVSAIDAYKAGYIDKKLEKIVGIQTEKPFERAFMPYGGIKMAKFAAEAYGFKLDQQIEDFFNKYVKTQNESIFQVYSSEMRLARKSHIISGLPDAYARGRIIGDYRRVALYGIDFLIEEKQKDFNSITGDMTPEKIAQKEQIFEQILALKAMITMAAEYGFDISKPAMNSKEAIQWTYFGYLAAIRDQNGAAMSLGRVSTFFDIYIERDLRNNKITESEAQELIDHFVMKLRIVKFMRPPAYNEIFAGDPVWATESIGGMGLDGRTLVTKSSFRMIHTLSNMGPAPEPNLTVLWSTKLPVDFKKFCAQYSILFSSIQYESDDLMRKTHGDDYGIACCVSPMKLGKQMQFFGARANIAKALLYSINNGYDELQPELGKMPSLKINELVNKDVLKYSEVWKNFKITLSWLARLYVNTLNVIHCQHDKYNYEAAQLALYDKDIHIFFATGLAGLSVVADSLSAIKYAKVKPIWKNNITTGFNIEGDFPKYGNDDNRVDKIAIKVAEFFINEIKKVKTYKDAEATMSILTITSNVMYGKNTGSTPDGRIKGEAFAPGANPMHGRDCCGAIASLTSVAKIPFKYAMDGISNTFSIIPGALGKESGAAVIASNILDVDLVEKQQKQSCRSKPSCKKQPSKK